MAALPAPASGRHSPCSRPSRNLRIAPAMACLLVPAAITLALALTPVAVPGAPATQQPGFMPMVTDPLAVFGIPSLSEPRYLAPLRDPVFGAWVLRVGGDAGVPLLSPAGRWADVARHVYSKQQPWNADHSLLSIRNTGSAASPLLLHGTTYVPVRGPCANYDRWDYRWHPNPAHPHEQVNVNRAGTELMWFDVMNCIRTRTWTLPIVAAYGIGSGEGNVSADGRFVAIANQQQMVVVDMDPQWPDAPAWPHVRIGPVYTFPPCSLDVTRPGLGVVDHVAISPSGRYIDVKFGSLAGAGAAQCDTLCDMHRIFTVDSALVIRPHTMSAGALRCGSFAARTDGWIFPLKHADMTVDPFDGNEDVIVGGRACPGSGLGRVVKVRLRDGRVTALTDAGNEAPYSHGSGRNTLRPGWFYVTYSGDASAAGRRFWGEVVAVKLDGSGEVQRFAHHHSTQSSYDAEVQAVPAPDGRRLLFASDWRDHCTTCGKLNAAKAYIVDAQAVALADAGPSPPPGTALTLACETRSGGGLVARFALSGRGAARLELHDVAGRKLLHRRLDGLGPGPHRLELDPADALRCGVYFLTLVEGRERVTARGVLLR